MSGKEIQMMRVVYGNRETQRREREGDIWPA
jgi:hypothetical protein